MGEKLWIKQVLMKIINHIIIIYYLKKSLSLKSNHIVLIVPLQTTFYALDERQSDSVLPRLQCETTHGIL